MKRKNYKGEEIEISDIAYVCIMMHQAINPEIFKSSEHLKREDFADAAVCAAINLGVINEFKEKLEFFGYIK
jgi:hypothetical protein